jgi:hypothetical protein
VLVMTNSNLAVRQFLKGLNVSGGCKKLDAAIIFDNVQR